LALHVGTGVRSDINVTPLVDVVLVLLIIFMAITPLLEREMPVRIPEEPKQEQQQQPPPTDQYLVRLQKDGRIFLNKDELDRDSLRERLKAVYSGLKGGVLFVDADDDAIYGDVIGIIDICREAGVGTVGTVLRSVPSEVIPAGPTAPAPAPAPSPAPTK
jgi:biopolymer transport protein ExbD